MISATPGREVRQELYLNTQYEKARQDVGLFYYIRLFTNINYSKKLVKIAIYGFIKRKKLFDIYIKKLITRIM